MPCRPCHSHAIALRWHPEGLVPLPWAMWASLSSGWCPLPGIVHVPLPECGFPPQWDQPLLFLFPKAPPKDRLPKRLQLDPVSLVPQALGHLQQPSGAPFSRLHRRWEYSTSLVPPGSHGGHCVQCPPWSAPCHSWAFAEHSSGSGCWLLRSRQMFRLCVFSTIG